MAHAAAHPNNPDEPPTRRRLPRLPTGAPVQTWLITVVLAVYGVGLIVQSSRWYSTPAYGVLLKIMSADAWGLVHLIAAALMLAGIALPRNRVLGIAAHTFVIVLLAVWEFSFIVRWITDAATTPVNPINWLALLVIAVWSAKLIDRPQLPA